MLTQLIGVVERIIVAGRTHSINFRFFRAAMLMIMLGYFWGYPLPFVAKGVSLAAGVSLLALGIRYLERRLR